MLAPGVRARGSALIRRAIHEAPTPTPLAVAARPLCQAAAEGQRQLLAQRRRRLPGDALLQPASLKVLGRHHPSVQHWSLQLERRPGALPLSVLYRGAATNSSQHVGADEGSSPGGSSRSSSSQNTASRRPATPATAATNSLGERPRSMQAHLQLRLASTKAIVGDKKELQRKVKKMAWKLAVKAFQMTKKVVFHTGSLTWAFIKNPRVVFEWYEHIREAVKHFVQWVVTGFKLMGADLRASSFLMKRVALGHPLRVRERQLLVRTTSDCLKLIPFSFFLIVPFAELALPFVLRLFPSMLPSTFFQQKYDNATLARKFKAKEEMAEFFQEVVHQRTKEIMQSDDEKFADKKVELQEFQDKLLEGSEYPTLKEILRFSKLFKEELTLEKMSDNQLGALSRMLGLPQSKSWWKGHMEVQLRHHITQLRREDRDYMWEGIDGLSTVELVEACKKRAICFHEVTDEEMRWGLTRWLEISTNHRSIPTSMLLWIQSFYLRGTPQAMTEAAIDELRMEDKKVDEETKEAEESAFQHMAEKRKAMAESAEKKLEELRAEISEVIKQSSESEQPLLEGGDSKVVEEKRVDEDEEEKRGFAMEEVKQAKQKLIEEKEYLAQTLKLYKSVVSWQKDLLDEQLKFLLSMRQNKPSQNKDADMILLDQRVRLMEMVGAFEKRFEDIEAVLKAVDEPADTAPGSGGAGASDFAEGFASKVFGDSALPLSDSGGAAAGEQRRARTS
mmetsp:Transcript_178626/g.572616  ORF Transcript_178626/g.572616 Transcript_178626/m.572616 type:complete len:732 (+) Transcript_178626:120-2315(+)